jgi:cyclic pyranopterin phosphate synthase
LASRVDCLRVSVTDRCDLRCLYCMPREGLPRRARGDLLRFEEIVRVADFLRARYGLRTVRLTGGEPLLRNGIAALARMLTAAGIEDVALTTNAQRLAAMAPQLRESGVGRVNISLDSLDPARFARLTRGGSLQAALEGIEAARAAGFGSIKINMVVLGGENDDEVCEFVQFAIERGLQLRFLELMSIGEAVARHAAWFVPADAILERLRTRFRLLPVQNSNPERARPYIAEDAQGRTARIGFIAPESHPFCSSCRRLRLSSDGRLLGCLMQARGVDLPPILRGADPGDVRLDAAVREAIGSKPAMRARTSDQWMAAVGG